VSFPVDEFDTRRFGKCKFHLVQVSCLIHTRVTQLVHCTNCTKKDRFSQLFALWTLCHGRSAASEQCSTCNRLSKSVHCPPRLKQTRRNRRHPSSSMAEPHHLQILYILHYTVYSILSMAACCPPLILAQTIARQQSDSGLNPARLRFAMTSLETSYPFAW
jgi:hypothetical protein